MSGTNQEIVAQLYDAFARGDVQRAHELIDPRFVVCQTDELPWGGVHEGVPGFRTFTERLLGTIESRVTVEEYVDAGDHMVAIGRTAGQVRWTGVAFDVRIAHVWTLRDRHATRFEPYIDKPGMLRAFNARWLRRASHPSDKQRERVV